MEITVIGAGIGGLTAAASLIRCGHRVRVYEQAAEPGEVGAAVQMSANAVKVLFQLGLKPTLESLGVKPGAFEFRRFDDGELLHEIKLGPAHAAAHGAPYYQIHRVDLLAALLNAVSAMDSQAVQFGRRAQEIRESDEHAEIVFSDGSAARSDLLVGADGIKSVVRQHVVNAEPPTFTGQVAWRLAIPTERIPEPMRPPVVSTIWCGPKNHAATYYMRSGALLNFVGCVERPWEEESWTIRRPWSELDEDYAGWHPIVRTVIAHADRDQCFRWALNNRKPVMTWSTAARHAAGRCGAPDAALPGPGAAMAIEDAAVLARALELDIPLASPCACTNGIVRRVRPGVVNESSEMAALYHISDANEMRNAFRERNIAASRNNWLYPYDPLTVALE